MTRLLRIPHLPAGRLLGRALPLLLALALAACGTPGFVEGETGDGPFRVSDPSPAARPAGDGVFVLLADEQGDELALVTIEIDDVASLPLGETVDLAAAGITVQASKGALEEWERSDGTRVVNARDPVFYPAVGGTFTLDSTEPLAGTFEVMLDDGMLTGSFFIAE